MMEWHVQLIVHCHGMDGMDELLVEIQMTEQQQQQQQGDEGLGIGISYLMLCILSML